MHARTIAAIVVVGGVALTARPASAQRHALTAVREAVEAPAPWLTQDPGDSLYRAARNTLSAGDYRAAARQFRALRERYPRSGYVADAYYFEAFARSKIGGKDELRTAVTLLDRQAEQYPDARTRRDARDLRVRVQGDLARLGDAGAAAAVAEAAAPLAAPPSPGAMREMAAPPAAPAPVAEPSGRASRQGNDCDDEDDERMMALNALLQMSSEQAMPILRQVLERRDAGSVCLRRQAIFLVSQHKSPETTQILLNAVRSDPDPEVRENAVFWLSQAPAPEAVPALDSILQHAGDTDLQEKAVFSLSQIKDAAANRALRAHLERPGTPDDIKENIIFWLGQGRSAENAQYLKEYFGKTTDPDLREKVLFSLSQMSGQDNGRWLLQVAQNESESVDVRKNALFWAGQMKSVPFADLAGLYDRVTAPDMKKQLIFVYSQRGNSAAIDKLMDIARNETDPDLRKDAMFWLSQSKDPRVAQFLLEVINK